MASLAPPFILCPLADSKEFLGISGDQEENKVILTIGKNIAIRYHVSEQKQEVSWASSRHWLTSKVVYCPDFQKYGSVIDHSTIGLWPEHDGHLAALKKYKYADPIFELTPTKTLGTLVIFKNGRVVPLSCHESEEKSTLPIDLRVDQDQEQIIAVDIDEKSKHIFLTCGDLTKKQKPTSKCGVGKLSSLRVVALKMESSLQGSSTLAPPPPTTKVVHTIEVFLESPSILGSCVIPNGEDSMVVYLCGDGFLYRRRLLPQMVAEVTVSTDTGSRIGNLSKYISKQSAVAIRCVDSSSIVLFGGDASDEGGVVCIYDVTYDLLLSKQSLKLYSVPPIMEKVGLSVFVPVGLHILVLGLRITKSLLSSVLGRHQLQSLDFFEHKDPWARGWGDDDDEADAQNNSLGPSERVDGVTDLQDFLSLVKTLEHHGQPQSVICGQVIPTMIEQRNFGALNWSLEYFSDIPEPLLVAVLTFLLSSIEKTEVTEGKSGQRSTYPSNGQINQVLERSFDQRQMIRSLRSMDFENVKKFLEYLCCRLENTWEIDFEDAERVSQLIKWICTTFDAHYPHFVFHNETAIVDSLLSLVEEKSKVMRDLEGLEPLLVSAIAKVSFQPTPSANSKFRTETVLFE